MDLASYRKAKGLSQQAFAEALGLKSKGYVSEIETAGKCSVTVALKIEEWSGGDIAAHELNAEVALIRSSAA